MQKSVRKLCVLGYKIAYTRSPKLHAAIFSFLGEQGFYGVEDVAPKDLESELPRLMREYDGFNITQPYKEKTAALLGSDAPINTVRCGDGAYASTDAVGFLSDYVAAFGAPAGNILLLGAGGAAKAVADALRPRNDVRLFVYNRTAEKAKMLAGGNVTAITHCDGRYDTVINATSLGLHGEQSAPAELSLKGVRYAYDLIYAPAQTPFLLKAQAEGAQTRNGLGMLVWQAIAAHEFWREKPFDTKTKQRLAAFATEAIRD